MNSPATRVAPVAPPTHATRNFGTDKRNNGRNANATSMVHVPMTACELRAQLRAQQERNRGVAPGATGSPFVAPKVAPSVARQSGQCQAAPLAFVDGQQAQQGAQHGDEAPLNSLYENTAVAPCMYRVLASATDVENDTRGTPTVVNYLLTNSKGGTLIDPDGSEAAVRELHWRFGDRVDWPALLAMFEAREQRADREAVALIRRLMADTYREASGR
jgi:hypothetical protein